MLSLIKGLVTGFGRQVAIWRGLHVFTFVGDEPTELERKTIYVIGEDGHVWFAAMGCPCGCGETIKLSMVQGSRPRWGFTRHWDDTVTLSPSIWRQIGCRSHFWIRHGRVDWC